MSRRVLSLPLRLASTSSIKSQSTQWVCRRCLATQPDTTTPSSHEIPSIPTTTTTSTASGAAVSDNVSSSSATPESYDPRLPTTQRDYPLSKTDFYLKKALPHPVPLQFLHHSTSDLLPPKERAQREGAIASGVAKTLTGVVVSAGKMDKTVGVRVPTRVWNKRVSKYFSSHERYLVHDPNNSLVTGDVISIHRLTFSTSVKHTVASIIAPFGTSIDQRPPIPTADEYLAAYKAKRFAKLHRRALRKAAAEGDAKAIAALDAMGLGEKDASELRGATKGKGEAKAARVRAAKEARKVAKAAALESKAEALKATEVVEEKDMT